MQTLINICNIIRQFMNLNNQQVYIFNQKYILPNDTGLYICVGLQGENILSNTNEHKLINNEYKEIITIQKQQVISINIYSYDFSAIDRKEEILMALNSDYSENMQNQYGFHIGCIPTSFTMVSEVDGTKILNRFNIHINVISSKQIIKNSNYYETNNFLLIKNN